MLHKVTRFVELMSPLTFIPQAIDGAMSRLEADLVEDTDMRNWVENPKILYTSIWWSETNPNLRIQVFSLRYREAGKTNALFISTTGVNEKKLKQIVNDLRQFLVEELVDETN